MSASVTEHLDKALLNHVFRKVEYKSPAALYVGLFVGHPSSGYEVVADGYARRQVEFREPDLDPDTGELGVANAEELTFPKAASGWGRISHFGVFDAPEGGNLLSPGSFKRAKLIEADDIFSISKRELRVNRQKPERGA